MSKIDYQALRAKAEKATCGEWSLEYGESRFDGDDALIRERIYQTSIRPFRKATYTHFPEIDPRLRNYRSRYGAISND